jgi:hypothetical protein
MKNYITKPIFAIPLMIMLIVASLSANKSIWPSTRGLTSQNKMSCVQFQSLNGSNRIDEFKKVAQAAFGIADFTTKNTTHATNNFSIYDVEKMLGKPNEISLTGNWVYYLNPNQQSCKAIFSVNKTTQSISCYIDNCN